MPNDKSRIQVLVATMNQQDHKLLDKMNIQTDAIICNQTNCNSVEKFIHNGNSITYINTETKGVGINRNLGLMMANADYCLLADDDMEYVDDYAKIIDEKFSEIPDADVLIFNLEEKDIKRYQITNQHKVSFHNYLRYGTARIAIRLDKIRLNGISFNQCFGGGCQFLHGEDNLFLTSCLKSKLKIYAVPICIATLSNERESTWEQGYTEKYFLDQGILYSRISHRFWKLLCLQDCIRHRKRYSETGNPFHIYKIMTSSHWAKE